MSARTARTIAAAVPVVLVNGVAFTGQLAFLRAHLPWPLPGQLMMAAALESVAVYLAFQAHLAQLAQDSALRLKLASYGFALVIAGLNYSHYAAPHWRPTFAAVAVALMSASSPWLWAIHSRRTSRDAMIKAGLIEGRAVRLGATRWLWHPLRSARVMWSATWRGITDPREAITTWEAGRSANRPAELPTTPPLAAAPAGPQTGTEVPSKAVSRPARKALPRPVLDEPAKSARRTGSDRSGKRPGRATEQDAETEFAAEIAAGEIPGVYQIRTRLHVGYDRARVLRQHIARQALAT